MTPEEAVIKAAATNQLLWIDSLLDTFDGDLADAISSAPVNGHVDMMHRLPIGEDSDSDDGDFSSESDDFSDDSDEDSEDDDVEERIADKTRRALQNAVQTAAQYGQLTVVSFFLPQIVGASDDGEARRDMHDTTWKVLNEAAAYGHFDVIQFAVSYATECGYIELYAASGRNDAVATYILGMRNIQWDLDRASDKAIQGQRSGLGN
ncbi:uncharacterized protein PITG_11336 [Phytophthora infestans T30-4]|uniref:Uncharacterized protein n=1 Tax=Phytophthora infestans (strain T30-4) TaxID=403677 RepID=D0NIK0_PHYIT|nr:uncharacterized protein PITG_11336 [Phytophthora infestans T30-4]EEY59334.1 hypothetical protein PITG_11336 [Phytophthora infestans T30-4]|eukprot:XP_002900944.1 hypothetical protein PITG_11336 [Phytophthora infestans T30-4]